MCRFIPCFVLVVLFTAISIAADQPVINPPPATLEVVGPAAVKLQPGFWADWMKVIRTQTIPHELDKCESTGRIRNFDRAAGKNSTPYEGQFFNDSDVYKVIEGAAYVLMQERDQGIESRIDPIIDRIVAAQQKNGYLYTFYTANHQLDKAFTDEKDMHETYCAGHLIEAGIAYFQATGKRQLFDAAVKCANHLTTVFGPNKRRDVPGHEEIELALLKLYGVTHQPRYLNLAQFFIDQRGHPQGRATNGDYDQDRIPVANQREIVGHAVRAMYLYSAVTDLELLTGQTQYDAALDSIWRDVVNRKTYITGGIGSSGSNEGFTSAYDLPNESAYAETCAAVGLGLWGDRMGRLRGESQYADIVERGMYNGILSGISLSGTKFFYTNPLASDGTHHRQDWFDCACCPPNVERYIASVGGRIYAHNDDEIYVNQYIASEATIPLKDTPVTIIQTTKYPWDGEIRLFVSPEKESEFAVKLRIPDWSEHCTIAINDNPIDRVNDKNGYAVIRRKWTPGDVVEMNIPMPIQRVYADPHVKADVGRVALRRGPIIYCLEGVDQPGVELKHFVLPKDAPITDIFEDSTLGGVTVLRGHGKVVVDDVSSHDKDVAFTAVPYFAWDNRAPGEMSVWLAENRSAVKATTEPVTDAK